MFLLGTLVPVVGLDGMARSILQPLVGVIDLLGMYWAITKTVGKPEIKILSVLVGWGLTESLLSTLLVYWQGARQYEFSWEFIQMALTQNVELVQLASTVTLVWLWTRQDLSQSVVLFISGYIDEGFHVPAACRIWISDIASSDQCRHHGAHLNFRALTLSFNHKIIFVSTVKIEKIPLGNLNRP